MRIVHITPGVGNSFYCENCVRDMELIRALRELGHEVVVTPLYLPLFDDGQPVSEEVPVFYGALNVYLKQKCALFRKAPRWFERLLDGRGILGWIATHTGSTGARGLEGMTLSMLNGPNGNQASELARLMTWLRDGVKPDIVHLSNMLLSGLAPSIKAGLDVPVTCYMQDEISWVNAMEEQGAAKVLAAISRNAESIAAMFSVSDYYSDIVASHIDGARSRTRMVGVGMDVARYRQSALPLDPPVIGFLSKEAYSLGLDVAVDAFMRLKGGTPFTGVRLRICGGSSVGDKSFIADLKKRLSAAGMLDSVDFVQGFDRKTRLEFLESLTVMAVPSRDDQAFGVYLLEAMAAGVPVVQSRQFVFPEIIGATGGGILYDGVDADSLSSALAELLGNPERLRELGEAGRAAAAERFGVRTVADRITSVWKELG